MRRGFFSFSEFSRTKYSLNPVVPLWAGCPLLGLGPNGSLNRDAFLTKPGLQSAKRLKIVRAGVA
jgi:hypothetical protein